MLEKERVKTSVGEGYLGRTVGKAGRTVNKVVV